MLQFLLADVLRCTVQQPSIISSSFEVEWFQRFCGLVGSVVGAKVNECQRVCAYMRSCVCVCVFDSVWWLGGGSACGHCPAPVTRVHRRSESCDLQAVCGHAHYFVDRHQYVPSIHWPLRAGLLPRRL